MARKNFEFFEPTLPQIGKVDKGYIMFFLFFI